MKTLILLSALVAIATAIVPCGDLAEGETEYDESGCGYCVCLSGAMACAQVSNCGQAEPEQCNIEGHMISVNSGIMLDDEQGCRACECRPGPIITCRGC